MDQSSTAPLASDRLTLLVFKGNLASRTFQIPFRWISRFGFFLGLLTVTSCVSLFLATKFYWIHLRADSAPTRELHQIQEMEQQLSDLRQQLKTAQTAKPVDVAQTQNSGSGNPLAAQVPVEPAATAGIGTLFPAAVSEPLPDPASLPFSIEAIKTGWRGRTLKFSFALQYNKEEGSQQGRILVVARGPDAILGYPSGIFQGNPTSPLITAENGESFSVSRYREVKAEFGPIKPGSTLNTLEVLIFNRENKLLVHRNLPVPTLAVAAPPKEIPVESATEEKSTSNPESTQAPIVPPTENPIPTPEAATHEP